MEINYDSVHPVDPKANLVISPVVARQRLIFALSHLCDIRSESLFSRFLDDAVKVLHKMPNLRRSSLRDAFEGKICAPVGVMDINRLKMRLDEILLLADVCETLAAEKCEASSHAEAVTETVDEPCVAVKAKPEKGKRPQPKQAKDTVLDTIIG